MPFPKQEPQPFTKARIESLGADQMGCYGLFREGVWIYVGKGDIRERLLKHFNGDNPCITKAKPTHWVDMMTPHMDDEEKKLTLEFTPICNKRVG